MTDTDYWWVLEPVWDQIDIDGPETFLSSASRIPRPLVLLYSAHFCASEVCNGGFAQFFDNSTGVLGPEAAEGFAALGLPEMAATVSTAISRFGPTYPRARETRQEAMTEEMQEGFEPLNDRFYALIESEGGGFQRAAGKFAQGISS